ncbi:hypothetical protein FE236_09770 [Mariprofundus erugo]|uniref:Flagellar FliJ protein n=1 Tax=Mariprofundus erugo TaxID=2528639 RepID=A0A5R9GUX7_9PROT|nr:hypothetical protein FEF65_00145 [Mariprofundus erugo]TLS75281.1 hypothetical protein FE236_09770 [Mariprofundus erugo]
MVQLSEQERNAVEAELAELNRQSQQLRGQQQHANQHITQLHRQRDQIMKQGNTASLLQAFNASLIEQQHVISIINNNIYQLEQQKQTILSRLKEACKTHHAYETVHHQEEHRQQRQMEMSSQRQLDDLIASRASARAASES